MSMSSVRAGLLFDWMLACLSTIRGCVQPSYEMARSAHPLQVKTRRNSDLSGAAGGATISRLARPWATFGGSSSNR